VRLGFREGRILDGRRLLDAAMDCAVVDSLRARPTHRAQALAFLYSMDVAFDSEQVFSIHDGDLILMPE
jgi:hypothetical protein